MKIRCWAIAVATAALCAACTVSTSPAATSPASQATNVTPPPPPADQEALDQLQVLDRPPADDPTYQRDHFGPRWSDTDGNGCNQRDDVLVRDAVPGTVTVQQQGACDHDVLAGEWIDPYDGSALTMTDAKDPKQSQIVQIDHIVPLAEAWKSGADAWTDQQRLQFANDIDIVLIAAGATNNAKQDQDPASWRPTQSYQCDYAHRWITAKATYNLAIDPPEKQALAEMLATCP